MPGWAMGVDVHVLSVYAINMWCGGGVGGGAYQSAMHGWLVEVHIHVWCLCCTKQMCVCVWGGIS